MHGSMVIFGWDQQDWNCSVKVGDLVKKRNTGQIGIIVEDSNDNYRTVTQWIRVLIDGRNSGWTTIENYKAMYASR